MVVLMFSLLFAAALMIDSSARASMNSVFDEAYPRFAALELDRRTRDRLEELQDASRDARAWLDVFHGDFDHLTDLLACGELLTEPTDRPARAALRVLSILSYADPAVPIPEKALSYAKQLFVLAAVHPNAALAARAGQLLEDWITTLRRRRAPTDLAKFFSDPRQLRATYDFSRAHFEAAWPAEDFPLALTERWRPLPSPRGVTRGTARKVR